MTNNGEQFFASDSSPLQTFSTSDPEAGSSALAESTNRISIRPIGTYESGVFDEGAAEIVAYDSGTQRVFVVNANNATVDVLDISDPTNPNKIFEIDVQPYGAVANSVSVYDGVVAVAVENADSQAPGTVAFFDSDGNAISAVTVGALPDMVTFTPDGQKVLVANEGEPSGDYTIDPEGSVSIIDISEGVASLTQTNVTTADFREFNDQQEALLEAGVRIFGPNASVAQDLEPEYITVSEDSQTAWVALQENNALGVLDIASGEMTDILPLGFKNYASKLETFKFDDLPILGMTEAGQDILLGGLSGLAFEGMNPDNGNLQFITHFDQGPNANPFDADGDGVEERPFALPDLQPEWVRFELDRSTGELEITDRIGLTQSDGTPLTGLTNLEGTPGLAYADEALTDLSGNPLGFDPLGADFEGIVRDPDGTYWMVEEYRPSIYHFTPEGQLIERFVPEGSNAFGVNTGTEALPAVYAQRQANRGFEAVALQDDKLYAFMQSPIDNPDVVDDSNSANSTSVRILEFDTQTKTTTGEYLYRLEGGESDKIGDAVSLSNDEFLLIERDSDVLTDALKQIFQIDLTEATNLSTLDPSMVGSGGSLESLTDDQLASQGIQPVSKELVVDLIDVGYDFGDKPEGLAMIDENTIAVLNDDDFRLAGGVDLTTGLLEVNRDPFEPVLGLISLNENGLDASDRDDAINIQNWPVLGMYQPDAISSYEVNGETFIITANEGDSRDYDSFSEEARVEDLVLDPDAFPNAKELQTDEALGRLKVTTANGISDAAVFKAELSSDQEVSLKDSQASGTATLKLNDAGDALSYNLTVSGLDFGSILGEDPQTPDTEDDVTQLHIHNAPSGENGSVVFGLFNPNQDNDLSAMINPDGSTTISGAWTETDPANQPLSNFVPTLLDSDLGEEVDLYFNVHTEGSPEGEIRGQITSTVAYDQLYSFGGRSFAIWDTQGNLLYDSGDDFEQITAAVIPEEFNSNNDENDSFDTRSDDKGPEPEGVTVGEIGDRTYAFIGLERVGGIMVYDVTDPVSPSFIQYINNRDFDGDPEAGTAGDLGPEGLTFIAAEDSPNGQPLLAVANEVSGSTTLFEISIAEEEPPESTKELQFGTPENDELFAGTNEFIFGGDGDDILDAYAGNGGNRLYGGDGDDILIAGSNDRLFGGSDNDILFAGQGDNILSSGSGEDQFWIAYEGIPMSANTILDFTPGNDVLGIAGLPEVTGIDDLSLMQSEDDTLISALGQDLAVLSGVHSSTLNSNSFVFA